MSEFRLSQRETMEVMGKVEEKEISNKTILRFDEKMQTPLLASLHSDWQAFKKFFKHNPKSLIEPFDLNKNTPLHVVTHSDEPQLLIDFLDMLPETDRWRALRMGNAHENTLLHHVIQCKNVNMVDFIMEYEKKVMPPPAKDEIEPEENGRPLMELGNDLGETPVYRAAKYGQLRILKQMAKYAPEENMQRHFYRKADRTSILHIAVIGQYFDVALWLWRSVSGIDKLANDLDANGLTCLQMLSRMPSAFRSHGGLGTIEELIYFHLPEPYDNYVDDDKVLIRRRTRRDPESGKDTYVEQPASVLSRVNYALWKLIAEEWEEIDHIWQKKKKHKLAEQLADCLVQNDYSWRNTFQAKPRTEVVMPVIQPSNVAARKKAKLESQTIEQLVVKSSLYTPLLLAASTGIVEIVKRIIDRYPDAIDHVSHEDEQNVLHVVVKHSQRKIYKVLKRYGALKRLASRMSNKGRTLLHQVARMDYYDGGNQAGVVFQLQDELRWFERVKKVVPCHIVLFCNDENLTATELFEIEHAEMLKEAQDWIKATAQSCSAVAVLVATVVFAAAYTVPGGTDDNGVPVFLNSPLFLFFTITDVLALASSLVSVTMFLSILTSPFQLQEFHMSLPRKLTMGFTLLFFALTTTMLAFGSTILLTIRLEKTKWSTSLIYSITFFPVALFGLTQFPIYMAVKYRLKRLCKTFKKLVPSTLIKSTKAKKKRRYSKYL